MKFAFVISEDMVRDFIELTSDRSALHTNELFARRSPYRQKVVHGMLLVLFAAAAVSNCCRRLHILRSLSANFFKPVFEADALEMNVSSPAPSEAAQERVLDFAIRKTCDQSDIAKGRIVMRHGSENPGPEDDQGIATIRGLLTSALREEAVEFDSIEKGSSKSFDFQLSGTHLKTAIEILRRGLGNREAFLERGSLSAELRAFLPVTLLSTFTGMCLPGRHATLTGFEAEIMDLPLMGKTYLFKGQVDFKSVSTRSLMEGFSVQEASGGRQEIIRGKIKVQVNKPPTRMPSLEDLKGREMDLGLKDKVVLVTGASRGLGETIAKLFSLYGAKVVVNYLKGHEDAESVVTQIRQSGGQAIKAQADVSERGQVRRMFEEIGKIYGFVDILVNSAVRDALPIPFMELTWEEIQRDLDVAVRGAFNCCQEALPGMRQKKSGKIINLSTVFAEAPPPGQAKYVLSKSALVGLTRSLAVEFASENIQVNLIVSSMAETDLTQHVPKIHLELAKKESLMKRHVRPEEVAKTAVFLASSLSSFTTGQKIMVTGGGLPFL